MLIEVIQRGETLYEIARRYGVTVDSIVSANELPDPNTLVVGQAIVIPTRGRFHTVQRGESLWQIARRYGTSVEAISRVNQIQNPAQIQTGTRLIIPRGTRPQIETNGYLTQISAEGAQKVRDTGENLTYISPFSYHVLSNGSLQPINDGAVLNAAKAENVSPLMVITNFSQGFSSELAHTILSNPTLQNEVLTNVLRIMREKGYTGLNIDFEYVFPRDRQNYNNFLRRAVDRLHPEGYTVSTALAPKYSTGQSGLLYEAHDYAFHGRTADFVVLMTYEWGWAGGAPRAISPITEMRKVLNYAVREIPRDKIMMGVSTYGRDWRLPFVAGVTRARTISEQQAVDLAREHNVDILYDWTAHAPHFRYRDSQGREHEVWYEDARSIEAKYELVRSYRLRGLSYWVLDSRLPQSWLLLQDDFQIKKL
ncbi:MAG TPA: LysM peptidoglycan-binding domain-containing protein [Bacillales bacterium]|nr:LysM peptidoglycan-binding domain-containing protein [Bacillales bacterium]